MPISPEKAQELLNAGLITQQTFQRVAGAPAPTPMQDPLAINPALLANPAPRNPAQQAELPPLEGFEKLEYGIGLAAEPFIAPFAGTMPKEYDRKLREKIIASRSTGPNAQAPLDQAPMNQAPESGPIGRQIAGDPQMDPSIEIQNQTGSGPTKQTAPTSGGGSGLDGYGKQRRGVELQSKAWEEQGRRDAAYYAGAEKAAADHANEMQQVQKEQDELYNSFLDRDKKEREDLAKLEPKSFWSDKSTGAKVGAAIAVAFGQYSSSINGGPNAALSIIESAVNNDLKQQQLKYQLARDKRQDSKDVFGLQMKKYGDQRLASQATYAIGLEKVKTQIQQSAALAKTQEAAGKAQQMIGEIDARQSQVAAELAMKQLELQAKQTSAQSEHAKRFVPHFGQMATTEEGAKELNKLAADAYKAKSGINSLLEIAGTTAKSISPDLRKKAEVTASMLKGAMRTTVLGPGAVTETEWKLLNGIVADPASMFSLDSRNKIALKTLLETIDTNLEATGAAWGLQTNRDFSAGAGTNFGKMTPIGRPR